MAAFRVGVGYVTWASSEAPLAELRFGPEVLTSRLDDLFSMGRKYTAFVVGPGLGVDKTTFDLISRLKAMNAAVVADADAITVIAREKIRDLPPHSILTPHTGELSRILGVSANEIEKTVSRRFGWLRKNWDATFCSRVIARSFPIEVRLSS